MKKAARGERLWDLCRSKTALNRWTSRAAQGGSRTDAAAGTGAGLHRREAVVLDSSPHGSLVYRGPISGQSPNPGVSLFFGRLISSFNLKPANASGDKSRPRLHPGAA